MENSHVISVVQKLVSGLDLGEAAVHSVTDFHAKGLHYVNLIRSPQYTAKLYFGRVGELEHNTPDGFIVNPHSHSYSFRQTVISGTLRNIVFHEGDFNEKSNSWFGADYYSPLKTAERVRMEFDEAETQMWNHSEVYGPATGYFMRPGDIHTLQSVHPVKPLILFTEQFQTEIQPPTRIYTRTKELVDLSTLYGEMSVDHLKELLDLLP